MKNFNKGDKVFLPDGREASYICSAGDDSHVVSITFDIDTGEYDEFYGHSISIRDSKIEVVDELFSEPPVERYAKEYCSVIQEKEKIIEGLNETIERLRKEESALSSNLKLIKENNEKYPCIGQALDFLEGRITHLVVRSYSGYAIKTFSEELEINESYDEGFKLLCLFGQAKDGYKLKTKWKLNQYYDGSGSWKEIHPCKSEEEAKTKLLELFMDNDVRAWRTGFSGGNIQVTLDANPWITPPEDWVSYKKEKDLKVKKEKVEKLIKNLNDLGVSVPAVAEGDLTSDG